MTEKRLIVGACHCGNIEVRLSTTFPRGAFVPRQCQCTFCRKHSAEYISDPQGRLEVLIKSESSLSRYHFETSTALFLICRDCGAVPAVTSEINGRLFALVNRNCLDTTEEFAEVVKTDFSAENVDARLARRSKAWISEVRIVESKKSS